jgi:DNA-binding LacI/PurR family transcriptional regulator
LAEQGHRRIAYLAGREDASTNLERERGFLEGLAEAGLPLFARGVGDYDMARAREATLKMFADPAHRPDAVCAASDQMAIAVIDALRYDLSLAVPDDVSVVGFDNVPQAQWPAYQLTTYEQPLAPMVESTIGLLKVQMQTGEVFQSRNVVVPGRLCLRQSTAPRRAR